jgi:predicted nucleotidyltransferase
MLERISLLVGEMLASLESIFKKNGIDFYLVGAVARDVHFLANPSFASGRTTNDIDIAIMVANEDQFYVLKEAILATGNFSAHETESIKLFYKHSIELDLLPFGGIENDNREVHIQRPRLFIIDVPGFKEVLPVAEEMSVTENVSLKVCSLEGLVLLKLIANDNNPSRTKDIIDIEHIVKVYFDFQSESIYQDHLDVMDIYDVNNNNYLELISARVIGRKIGVLLSQSEDLFLQVQNITRKRVTEIWQSLSAGMEDVEH